MLYPVLDLYVKTKLNLEVPGRQISVFVNEYMSSDEIENMCVHDIMNRIIEKNASEILGICLGTDKLDPDIALRTLKEYFNITPILKWTFDDGRDKNG